MQQERRTGAAVAPPRPHVHRWLRMSDCVGLFHCTNGHTCTVFAVCPGCLNSLDVALRARDGIAGVTLYWCPLHARREGL